MNLWKSVKIAKNLSGETLPMNMTLNNQPVAPGPFAESFAGHFSEKIRSNSIKAKLDANVYCKCKLIVGCRNFMTKKDVEECMNDLGSKKCEGFDRIPVCALTHSRIPLLEPMAALFDNFYLMKCCVGNSITHS